MRALAFVVAIAIAIVVGAVAIASRSSTARAASPVGDEAQERAAEGVAAYKDKRYREAGTRFDEARAFIDDAALTWNSGRAWERAGELTTARDRFVALLAREDVDVETRVQAKAALERVTKQLDARTSAAPGAERIAVYQYERRAALAEDNDELVRALDALIEAERANMPPPEPERMQPPPSNVVPWTVTLTGVLVAGAGVALALYGQGEIDSIEDHQRRAGGGPITDITRAEALDVRDNGETLRLAGAITAGVGAAGALTGLALVVAGASANGDAHTNVTLAPRPGGWEVACALRF